MATGRPPKMYSDEQVEELGKDLLAWIKGPDSKHTIMWVEWYWGKHNMFRDDWKALIRRPGFLPYYELARKYMSNSIVFNNKIAQSYGNRYLHKYDDELLHFEEEIKDRDAARNTKENSEKSIAETFAQYQAIARSLGFEMQPSIDKAVEATDSSKSPSQETSLPPSPDQQ